MSGTDVLLVSLGTTLGWRVADEVFLDGLRRAGLETAAARVRFGAAGPLRRGYPVNDLVEAAAARRAAESATQRLHPRAVVFSTTTAAMLAPRLEVPYAVRLDSPAALNRPGLRNLLLRPLERRGLGRARLVLPWSTAALQALPAEAAPVVVLPPPVMASGPTGEPREPLAVSYVPDPKAKGLDLLCAGWSSARVPGARLEVFGIARDAALAHLRRTGVPEPQAVEWRGTATPAEFRSALRRARVYVGAARWEDFGQAPLEALADGALLATVPSGGPFAALAPARELAPLLVAPSLDAAGLAAAVRAAFAMDEAQIEDYRRRATELMRAFQPEPIQRTLEERVLPRLLA